MLNYLCFKEMNDLLTSGQIPQARKLLMEIQSRCIALNDEMHILRIRLQNMENILRIARNLFCDHGLYWLNTNGLRQGPFCPKCYNLDGSLIRLEKIGDNKGCPCCGEIYRNTRNTSTKDIAHAKILFFNNSGS